MVKVTTHTGQVFEIESGADGVRLNQAPFAWDIQPINERTFHIVHHHQSYTAEIINADYTAKTFVIRVNGQTYSLTAQDSLDLLLETMGMSAAAATAVKEVRAPMPGLIVAVNVQPGQSVAKGDVLVVLEAMKMENAIKSPSDGVITAVKVTTRESVEKNQVLVQF